MVNYCIYTIFSKSPAKLLLFFYSCKRFRKKTKKNILRKNYLYMS